MITKEILSQICEENDIDLEGFDSFEMDDKQYVLYNVLSNISGQLTCNYMYGDGQLHVQLCIEIQDYTMYHNIFEWETGLELQENIDQINEAIEQAQKICNDLGINFIINPLSTNE